LDRKTRFSRTKCHEVTCVMLFEQIIGQDGHFPANDLTCFLRNRRFLDLDCRYLHAENGKVIFARLQSNVAYVRDALGIIEAHFTFSTVWSIISRAPPSWPGKSCRNHCSSFRRYSNQFNAFELLFLATCHM
jgi:hypothetical protein